MSEGDNASLLVSSSATYRDRCFVGDLAERRAFSSGESFVSELRAGTGCRAEVFGKRLIWELGMSPSDDSAPLFVTGGNEYNSGGCVRTSRINVWVCGSIWRKRYYKPLKEYSRYVGNIDNGDALMNRDSSMPCQITSRIVWSRGLCGAKLFGIDKKKGVDFVFIVPGLARSLSRVGSSIVLKSKSEMGQITLNLTMNWNQFTRILLRPWGHISWNQPRIAPGFPFRCHLTLIQTCR